MNARNEKLDLAKLLACIGVVGLHGVGMVNYTLYYLFTFSVPMFFMVSGYLMFSKEKITFRYSFRKALSYIRIILAWNIIMIVPIYIFRHKPINPFKESLRCILQQGYLWHFWFFGTMVILFLLLPLFHGHLKKYPLLHISLTAVFLICLLVMNIVSMRKETCPMLGIPQSLRLNVFGFYFLLGGVFVIDKVRGIVSKLPWYFYGILSLIFCVLSNFGQKHLGLYLYHTRLAEYFYSEFFVFVWIMFLFLFILNIPLENLSERIRTSKFFPKGNLTLGIFIIHPILLYVVDKLQLVPTCLSAILTWIGLFFVSALISLILNKIPVIRRLVKL